ncbi:MAG: MoaD/ThiS family protein [Thermoleophilia bacterium]|jgi:molybdopterin synthase sulfur carrier subunit|nr:MoaD/ThiS family protein [Thermoleophilia bacterium]
MATFRIPPVLRPLTGDQVKVDASGDTLGAALEVLFSTYPELRERMIDGDGSLRRFVNVYVDDEDVRTQQGLDTKLDDRSSVIVLPAMAGGAA